MWKSRAAINEIKSFQDSVLLMKKTQYVLFNTLTILKSVKKKKIMFITSQVQGGGNDLQKTF